MSYAQHCKGVINAQGQRLSMIDLVVKYTQQRIRNHKLSFDVICLFIARTLEMDGWFVDVDRPLTLEEEIKLELCYYLSFVERQRFDLQIQT